MILVCGLPGSGKTYFASRLAQSIDAIHLSSDTMRRASGKWEIYDEATKATIYDAMLFRASALVTDGKVVVLDATFYKKDIRDQFVRAAMRLGAKYALIEIRASEETIRQRITQPRKDSRADFDVYLKIRDAFEEITGDHLVLHSDDAGIDEMLVTAIEYLRSREKP